MPVNDAVSAPAVNTPAQPQECNDLNLTCDEPPLTRLQAEAACGLILNHSPDCIKLLDIEGRLLWINAPGCRLLEVADPAPLIGRLWTSLWPVSLRPDVIGAIQQARAGALGHFTGACPTFSGRLKWWDVIVVAIEATDDRGPLLLSLSRDVTELALALDRERAARADKEKLLATVSHELRSPMNAVLNWAVMLQADSREAESVALGRRIETVVLEQMQLVDELLDDHRRESAPVVRAFEPVALGRVAMDAVDMMRRLIESSERQITCDLDEGPVVAGDARRLKQVFINLLSNAMKFTLAGGRIAVTCTAADGVARVDVTDDGIGVMPGMAEQIFDPYCREERAAAADGIGLGLAISRRLVELHGGTLTLEQRPVGSAFIVAIPLTAPIPPGDGPPSGTEISTRQTRSMSPFRPSGKNPPRDVPPP